MTSPGSLLAQLVGGDRRSVGRANEVVARVLDEPELLAEVVPGLEHGDPVVRMRAADVLAKVGERRPELLRPFKREVLRAMASGQQEVRWHVAQMLAWLELTPGERDEAARTLVGYLDDRSAIVRVYALQALADFAASDARYRPLARERIEAALVSERASVRNRARKLVTRLVD
jgi:HEAT repeat protein